MRRIGLISDTHHYLDEAVFRYFEECDEIWHGGDFGTEEIINKLEAFKPLRGVYGNIDGYDVRSRMPEVASFKVEEVDVLMIHIGGYPNRYSPLAKKEIADKKPKLFISGHSHILKIIYDEKFQCLHMNPGAAGKQGWHKTRTLIRFSIDGSNISNCEVIGLGKR
ncbi:metallophosphoesterase family protein [Aridibaculum aurantiacum]|uniref:metallophosphoesterase family protein n=1 Tax=Aridibaculum aurantiacum TaxID=2810307 RepID=UPI001A970EB4|nr:metallophosphoesterase family protein [Aridibaculum aurantiacum]